MRVRLTDVHKYFGTEANVVKILENVNIDIRKGQFVAIMGPSGSGKSTLLFLMACLDVPTFGGVYLEDVEISKEEERVRERVRLLNIGLIFQNFNLLPTLTALENVLLPLQLSGKYPKDRENRAMTLLRLVGLEDKALEKPPSLSGGQQQRVAIARAISNMPGLLLADEPTGNLDARSGKEVMEVIKSINENHHITTVVVTHDPKTASFAEKVYYLHDGNLSATAI